MKYLKTFEKFYISTDVLYHYTSIENAISIIKDGLLKYRRSSLINKYSSNINISEDYGYVSFTENDEYHSLVNTDVPYDCRFVFDINKLEKDYVLVEFDANKAEKQIYLSDNEIDEDDLDDLDYQNINYYGDEYEVRVYEKDIPINKYLKFIELSTESEDDELYIELLNLCENEDIKYTKDVF